MRQASTTITTAGDIGVNIDSFRRHLAAENLSPRTVTSYLEATGQFARFLAEQGMPENLANIRREHVESFIAHLLSRWKASTANNRYRGLQSFFTWADEEGELTNGNPMAKMKPPRVPEEPPDVLSDDALEFTRALELPTFEAAGMTLIRRLTLVLRDGTVETVFYPVFPPDRNAAAVIAWLGNNPA